MCPGLKVVAPYDAADAKGLLKAAIRDPNPVVFLEHEMLYGQEFDVPDVDDWLVPIGKAKVRRAGDDVTLVAHARMVGFALKAAEELAGEGIEAEVIDLRTLRPLDHATVVESVKKTNRLVTVEEGWGPMGVGAEVAARVVEHAFDYLDAPPRGSTRKTCRCPTPPTWRPCRCRRWRRSSRRPRRSATDDRRCALRLARRRLPLRRRALRGGLARTRSRRRACNCSICAKTGFIHIIVPESRFRLTAGADRLSDLRLQHRTARHLFCATCGVKSFYRPRSNPDGWSVNARCLDDAEGLNIVVTEFDGLDWEGHGADLAHLSKEAS